VSGRWSSSSTPERGAVRKSPHRHFSPLGTPYTHLFGSEPAFLDRDLFLDFGIVNVEDGTAIGVVAELEWAFTRRLGIAVEIP